MLEAEVAGAVAFLERARRPWSHSIIVESNHDNALTRWLQDRGGADDEENAYYWHEMNAAWHQAIRRGDGKSWNPVQFAMRRASSDGLAGMTFIPEGQSYLICQATTPIECGLHGRQMESLTVLDHLKIGRGFWYLATPYARHPMGREIALLQACELAAEIMTRGIPVSCPIAHSHPIFEQSDGILPATHEFWMQMDLPIVGAAHGVIVGTLDSWEMSRGVRAEIECARLLGEPVESRPRHPRARHWGSREGGVVAGAWRGTGGVVRELVRERRCSATGAT